MYERVKYNEDKLDPRYKRKRETIRAWQRAHKEQVRNFPSRRTHVMLNAAKRKAWKLNLPFDLVKNDVIIPEFCPVFGLKLERGKGRSHYASPTLDRLIPSLGYVRGNVAVISMLANSMKGNATAVQHRRIADWMDQALPA